MSSGNGLKTGISRAAFLRGGAAAVAGLASAKLVAGSALAAPATVEGLADKASREASDVARGCRPWSWESKPVPIPASEIKTVQDVDILVIGAGLAGFSAALSAQEAGAHPVIIEKNATFGARGGHITAFKSRLQDSMGIALDYRQVIRRWVEWAQGRVNEDLLWQFARKSGACMDWMVDLVAPRGLKVALWDGYYKGPDYTELPVTHFFYKEGTNFLYTNGAVEGAGNAVLLPVLETIAKEKGIPVHYKTRAVQFVRDGNGPVIAVIAGSKGAYTRYNVARGVIIASGDYASNEEMRARYAQYSLAADSQIYFPNKCNTGDVHVMAMQTGGAMQRAEPHAAVIHLESGACSYGFLHVNGQGRRYKNEDVNTQSKSITKALQPGNTAWTIYDADGLSVVKDQIDAGLGGGLFFGQMFMRKGVKFDLDAERQILDNHLKSGKVVTADTLEDLARKMAVPVDNFIGTVKRYNEMVARRNDVDYGKRADLLAPIAKSPFYAGKLLSTVLTMVGGLRTDTRCRVLGEDDQPIANLYVVGAAAGDFFANDYPTICPGIGHGRCITFGRLAGIIAAGRSVDDFVGSIEI